MTYTSSSIFLGDMASSDHSLKKKAGTHHESWALQGHRIALRTKLDKHDSVIVSVGTWEHIATTVGLSTSRLWRFVCFETTMKLSWNSIFKKPHEFCVCVNGHVKCTQQSYTHAQCPPYLLSCMPVGVATTNLPMSKRKRDIRAYICTLAIRILSASDLP